MVQLPDKKIERVYIPYSRIKRKPAPDDALVLGGEADDYFNLRTVKNQDKRRDNRDDSDPFAPAPLNKGDGGNDTPSAGAETIVVKRKRQRASESI